MRGFYFSQPNHDTTYTVSSFGMDCIVNAHTPNQSGVPTRFRECDAPGPGIPGPSQHSVCGYTPGRYTDHALTSLPSPWTGEIIDVMPTEPGNVVCLVFSSFFRRNLSLAIHTSWNCLVIPKTDVLRPSLRFKKFLGLGSALVALRKYAGALTARYLTV
jgi:hypothetical protein